jgi:hypothetical protein
VLVCYLDDSGKDPQSEITTVAGYIARAEAWEAFESEVRPIFVERNVSILHAKEMHDTDGEFKGWTVLQKQAFVARIGQVSSRHLMMGMSMSALKGAYKANALARASDDKRTVTPYTFCFQVIADWVLRDIRIGRAANTEGVAFILEHGHENNPQAEQEFYNVRRMYKLENVLHSISFVPKDKCRAIQLADLLAFYSRRDSAALLKATNDGKDAYPIEMMIKVITESLPHRGFVATAFSNRPPA